jgi:hypothetical protein
VPLRPLVHGSNRDSGIRNSIVVQILRSTLGEDIRRIGNLFPGRQLYTIKNLFEARGYFSSAVPARERREFAVINTIQSLPDDRQVLGVALIKI